MPSYPINSPHRLLLEDGSSFLLLEDGTSHLVLDKYVAIDDPLNSATGISVTGALTFAGESLLYPLLVQTTTGTTGNTFPVSLSANAFPVAPLIGNTILAYLMLDGQASAQTTTMTDNYGNVYTRRGTAFLTTIDQVDIWQAPVTVSGGNFTVTGGGLGNTTASIIVHEWFGVTTFDQTAGATDATSTSRAVNTGATSTITSSPELVVVATGASTGTQVFAPGPGYQIPGLAIVSNPSTLAVEYQVITGLTTQTGTMSLKTAADWVAVICTFALAIPNLEYEIEIDTVNTFDSQ